MYEEFEVYSKFIYHICLLGLRKLKIWKTWHESNEKDITDMVIINLNGEGESYFSEIDSINVFENVNNNQIRSINEYVGEKYLRSLLKWQWLINA